MYKQRANETSDTDTKDRRMSAVDLQKWIQRKNQAQSEIRSTLREGSQLDKNKQLALCIWHSISNESRWKAAIDYFLDEEVAHNHTMFDGTLQLSCVTQCFTREHYSWFRWLAFAGMAVEAFMDCVPFGTAPQRLAKPKLYAVKQHIHLAGTTECMAVFSARARAFVPNR